LSAPTGDGRKSRKPKIKNPLGIFRTKKEELIMEMIVNNAYMIVGNDIAEFPEIDAGSVIFIPETDEHYLVTAPGEWVLVDEEEVSEEVTPEEETPIAPEDPVEPEGNQESSGNAEE
jgi:hypothetical protein